MKRGNKEGGNKRVPQNKLFPASRVFPLLGKIFQAKDESKGVGGFSTVLAKEKFNIILFFIRNGTNLAHHFIWALKLQFSEKVPIK